ncbi:alginate lyase [Granulicella sp. 5B5]|uniref:alginate lyase family protein n=1 Tax=Granulicella sp. 5B5 TaxID=1617967 RepID=UPI0015F6E39F|nr:alginate lyase family protein [Granulicella sp. 5B5]QMV19438.1 alginate lyase [Granulicella sp. 5B5]
MSVVRSSLSRRRFCLAGGSAALAAIGPGKLFASPHKVAVNVAAIDRSRILRAANGYLNAEPVTITTSHSTRSAGGLHDYFSEGDYWWPDPKHPGGPYIRQDGFSNPDNFNAHREALIRLSLIVPALTAAWKLTRQRRYAEQAAAHLRAWFIDPASRMNPNLQYAQAIFGITKGRGIGIIDTIHLVEPARAAHFLVDSDVFTLDEQVKLQGWFSDYLHWLTTTKNGADERDAKNNHGSCWVMQVAEFARFTGDASLQQYCRDRFRTVLIPNQVAANGSLPLEAARTKPYSYSLFDLDILATIAQILSTPQDDLFTFQLPDGRGLRKAVAYMEPFIADKKFWPYPHDVEYFDDLPVRQPSLLFGGLAYNDPQYIALWKTLNPDPKVPEIIRNYPIRQPMLWV